MRFRTTRRSRGASARIESAFAIVGDEVGPNGAVLRVFLEPRWGTLFVTGLPRGASSSATQRPSAGPEARVDPGFRLALAAPSLLTSP